MTATPERPALDEATLAFAEKVFDAARHPRLAAALNTLGTRLADDPGELLQGGRHQTFRLALSCGDETLDVVVKRFGRQ